MKQFLLFIVKCLELFKPLIRHVVCLCKTHFYYCSFIVWWFENVLSIYTLDSHPGVPGSQVPEEGTHAPGK